MTLRARAWTALCLPPLAWYLFQQGLAHAVHVACVRANAIGLAAGLIALLVCAGAGTLARKRAMPGMISSYVWLCRIALLGAAVFGLAIAFQTLAVALVPACAR